jgi:hypothetical protein
LADAGIKHAHHMTELGSAMMLVFTALAVAAVVALAWLVATVSRADGRRLPGGSCDPR